MLANQLTPKYQNQNCVVVALDDGGIMVGSQIAMALNCLMTLLASAAINLPREPEAIAALSENGTYSYNPVYSPGEVDELVGEYFGFIEQEKLTKLHELHRLAGSRELTSRELLKGKCVILVSDGLSSGFKLDLAAQVLKPIAYKKLVVAAPLASVPAVDRMHVMADDIYCLSVLEDYISTEHYYDQADVPNHDAAVKILQKVVAGQTA